MWTTVLRYGRLQSALVVLDVGFTHGAETACAPCSLVWLHAPAWRFLDGLFPLPTRFGVRCSQSDVNEVLEFVTLVVLSDKSGDGQDEGSSRFRLVFGLYRPARH